MREKVLTLYSSNNRKSGTTTEFINLPSPFLTHPPTHTEAKKREFILISVIINNNNNINNNDNIIFIINNNTEIIIITPRRAVAERAENIGIWFKILEMLAQLAVISNVSKMDPKRMDLKNDVNFRPSSSPSRRTSSRSLCTSTSTGRGG